MTHLAARVLAAYGVVSLVWGSTYLAIRVGVRHLPPALFGGTRFLTAGLLLLAAALALGRRLPRRSRDWATAALVGTMLLGIGNGAVIWAEQFVESGTTALIIVTAALWMALFDAVVPGGPARPSWRQAAGLLVGFAGTVVLVGGNPGALGSAGWWGPLALIGGAISWALGSVLANRRPVETSPEVHSALQMLAGGGLLTVVGLVSGEAAAFEFSLPGLGAIAYLIVFGSIVAYTSYVYLLRHAAPAFIGTHTYVNTVVAVLLGWMLLGERITLGTVAAMGVILGSVVWVRRESRPASSA